MRKIIALILTSAAALSLHAQLVVESPTGNTLLSTQISQMTQILAEEKLGNTAFMTEFIPRVKQSIDIANATLDTSRRIYGMYQEIKTMTPEKLLSETMNGFCNGFPGTCPGLRDSILEMKDNIDLIKGGQTANFFEYRSRWNSKTQTFLKNMVEGSMKAYVYPTIAPNMSRFYGFDAEPDTASEIFYESLTKSGLGQSLSLQNVQASMINTAVKAYLDDVDATKNLQARGQALSIAIQQQQAKGINDMALIEKKRIIDEKLAAFRQQESLRDYLIKQNDKKRKEQMKNDFKNFFKVKEVKSILEEE